MAADDSAGEGFEAGTVTLPGAPVELADDVRDTMLRTLVAVANGATPEQLAEYLTAGEFPPSVEDWLERPLERDEMNAHLDLLLNVEHGDA